jgi:hypothetical protein
MGTPGFSAVSDIRHAAFSDEPRASDADLLVRIGNGDRAAFEELYRRFARPVLGLALRLLGDHGRVPGEGETPPLLDGPVVVPA